jgi:hypothetical protein
LLDKLLPVLNIGIQHIPIVLRFAFLVYLFHLWDGWETPKTWKNLDPLRNSTLFRDSRWWLL